MKTTFILAFMIAILSFSFAFAGDKQPGKEPNQQPEPNQKPAPVFQQQSPDIEQIREHARQRIRQRMEQRRQLALQGKAVDTNNAIGESNGKDDANLTDGITDANVIKRRKETLEQLLTQQEAKYRERLARLTRIRELAKEQGDVNTVERVDKLIKQDVQLHQVKLQRMRRQQEMLESGKSPLSGRHRANLVRIEKPKDANLPDVNKDTVKPLQKKRP